MKNIAQKQDVRAMINSNMRCIEIAQIVCIGCGRVSINSNMRCIEIVTIRIC